MEKITAQEGKVFKIIGTEYYVSKVAEIGSKLITANGKLLEQPITITQDILEEVPAKPFIPLPEDDKEEE